MSSSNRPQGFTWVQNSGDRARRSASVSRFCRLLLAGWAAQWLTDGRDSEALREMAGLNGRDTRALADLLPTVLAEMGVDPLPGTLEAVTMVFRNIAADCLTGRLDERAVVQQVEEIVISHDYASEIIDLPLGLLYGLDDEWQGGWGATVEQLRATVRARCTDQLAQSPT
ncbi:hypothetical protein [Streptomyces sp. NPDC050121]|uniref:hypothetical protein n=1 Tax=Streptomyces sp. NPDC050121 TaxID=3365601 RepID=UPI00379E0AD1